MAPQLIADSYLLQCVASAVLSSILYSKRSFPLACFHRIPLEMLNQSNQEHFLLKITDEGLPLQEYIPLSTFDNDEVIYFRQYDGDLRFKAFLENLEGLILRSLKEQRLEECRLSFFQTKDRDPANLLESYTLRFKHHQSRRTDLAIHWAGRTATDLPTSSSHADILANSLSNDEEDKELGKLQLFLSSRPLRGPNSPEYLGVTIAGEITPEEAGQLEQWDFYSQQIQPAWEERRIALLRVVDVEDDSSSETIASEKETTPDSPKVPRRSNRIAGRPPAELPEMEPANPVPQSAPTSRKRKAQATPLEEPLMKFEVVLPTTEQVKAQNRLLPQNKPPSHNVGASSSEEPHTSIPDALSARKLPVNPLNPDSNDPGWSSDDFL